MYIYSNKNIRSMKTSKFRIVYFDFIERTHKITRIFEGNSERKKAMLELYKCDDPSARIVPPSGGAMWSDLIK